MNKNYVSQWKRAYGLTDQKHEHASIKIAGL